MSEAESAPRPPAGARAAAHPSASDAQAAPSRAPTTNVHVHLFSADHSPELQLYYLLVHYIAKALMVSEPALVADSLRTRVTMWLATLVSAIFPRFEQDGIEGLVRTVRDSSRVADAEVRRILVGDRPTTLGGFLRALRARIPPGPSDGEGRLGHALASLTRDLYAAHRRARGERGPVTHAEMLQRYRAARGGAVPFRRLVALAVDFDEAFPADRLGMRARPDEDYARQVADLEALLEAERRGGPSDSALLGFLGVDPRRFASPEALVSFVRDKAGPGRPWAGVKLYPPMGFLPGDLPEALFDLCQSECIPVTTHCAEGGAGARGKDERKDNAHPRHWVPVLTRLEARHGAGAAGMFRLNLAHFSELQTRDFRATWADEIMDLLARFDGARGVRVFSDISNDKVPPGARRKLRAYRANVRELVRRDIRARVLFGSDWWHNLPGSPHDGVFLERLGFGTRSPLFDAAELDAAADDFLSGAP